MSIPKTPQALKDTPMPRITKDNVNHPSHYTQGDIECIDAIAAATKNLTGMDAVCVAAVLKYVWRFKGKNGTEDLKKAQWYLTRLINHQTTPS